MKHFRAIALVALAVLAGRAAAADEIRVLTGNAVQGPQKALAEKFKAAMGAIESLVSTPREIPPCEL